jgi:AAA ATPase domain
MPLVGREAALAEIDSALKTLPSGGSVVLCLSGEPGIGKTRLLAELSVRANARGFLVLDGRAAEFERDTPFAAFVDALDDYLAEAGPRVLGLLPPTTVAHLATVFPAVTAPAHEPVTVLQAERYRIHRALRSLLDALAVSAPLVLILNDLHWVDSASAEMFAHLLTYPPSRHVLIATGYRPAQLGDSVRAALQRGEAEGRLHAIGVTPLSRTEAEQLVGDSVRPEAMDALYAESGGNPFYLLELAREGRVLPASGRPDGDVPAAVLAAIHREIAALPFDARLLAQGGAVAGEPFDLDAAAIATGLDSEVNLSAVDLLLAGGLLVPTDVPRRSGFRHPVVRRAVYESAGPGWRIGAHRRLAAALRDKGAFPVELAHHVAAAVEPGDTEAIDLLTEAGHALSVHAPAIAADRFAVALRLVPHDDPNQRRLKLLVPLATSLGAAGRLHESRSKLEEALIRKIKPGTGERHHRLGLGVSRSRGRGKVTTGW